MLIGGQKSTYHSAIYWLKSAARVVSHFAESKNRATQAEYWLQRQSARVSVSDTRPWSKKATRLASRSLIVYRQQTRHTNTQPLNVVRLRRHIFYSGHKSGAATARLIKKMRARVRFWRASMTPGCGRWQNAAPTACSQSITYFCAAFGVCSHSLSESGRHVAVCVAEIADLGLRPRPTPLRLREAPRQPLAPPAPGSLAL